MAPLNKKKEYLSDGTTGDWVAEIQGRRDEAAEDQKPALSLQNTERQGRGTLGRCSIDLINLEESLKMELMFE